MTRKSKSLYVLDNMQKLILVLATILFYAHSSFAIPASVTGNYTVFGLDNCLTTCTIQNGGTLTITGPSANSTFFGNITVMPGGKLII